MNERSLVLNPRVMGILADETGCIAEGKLVWSEQAWSELFFPAGSGIGGGGGRGGGEPETTPRPFTSGPWTHVLSMDTIGLRRLEEQMLYSRFALTFGWSPFVERLCVLGIEW